MNSFTRRLILAALTVAAIVCYSYGSSFGLSALIIIGAIFELAFWFGMFSKKVAIPTRTNTA